MPHATFTYEPLNVLKPLATDLWLVDGPKIHMSAGPLKLPFPTRMTVARLQDGGLWLHSPIALSPDLRARIDALGPVRHLIAPNKIHYAAVQQWLDAYPEATSWGVAGIEERARKNQIKVTLHHRLTDTPPPDWVVEFDQMLVTSNFMSEAIFFHRASRTLILTDLIENFAPERLSWPMRAMTWAAGNLGPDGSMPRDMRLTFRGRRDHLRAAIARMVGWAPKIVVLAHGDIYRDNATERLHRAFRWLGENAADSKERTTA